MNRPLCLLMLVLSGCDVPQDTASVVEITAAKPDSIAAPAAQGKQGGPPSKQPPTTDSRKTVAASDSDENRNHNPEGMPQEQQTTGHPHILETLGASVERNDQGEVVFLLLPLGSTITNENLVNLQEFPKLEVLILCNSQIKDAGLRHLKGLTNLRELLLGDTQITDAGMVHLVGLTELRELRLGIDTQVRGPGRAKLQEALPSLNIREY